MPLFTLKKNARSTKRSHTKREIDPDEIFLDSSNLPQFDQSQFEGRLEKPLDKRAIIGSGLFFIIIIITFLFKIINLQITQGAVYAEKSENNSLKQITIFPARGVLYDRNGTVLASNIDSESEFTHRTYKKIDGITHVVGYVRYPQKDSSGFYYQDKYEGVDGVEKIYNDALAGKKGLLIAETDAHGKLQSKSVIEPPQDGTSLTLSIDARIQEKLYNTIKELSNSIGFSGGAGVIMDVKNGEILTSVSYPEYDLNIMADRTDTKAIKALLSRKDNPFLNRVTDGLYTPGSIVKPFVALAALKEHIIDPKTTILSTGSISIPNPFDPTKTSVFKDWRAQGYVDMRQALAVSSDVYFYEIGGGFEMQPGLGINRIDSYMKQFGFGTEDPENPLLDRAGIIPTPAWKTDAFNGDPWRIGDTYNTSIGQYGFQVTAMQAVRGIASIANEGTLLEPTLIKQPTDIPSVQLKALNFTPEMFNVVKEGMRQAVIDGTAKGLNIQQLAIGAKTGTAELGTAKKYVNSWVVGFFPYDKPRYAFATLMEKGPHDNTIGALYVMRQLFEWMSINTPEYLK